MLYQVTVLDTDEHEPTGYSSSAKFNEAHQFGEFFVEAPAYRKYGNEYSEGGHHRMPDAVPRFAQDVAMQYLTYATYNKTVLVQISAVWPKRVGYPEGKNTPWTTTSPLSAFLLNSDYIGKPGDENDARRFRILATLD